jgi:2-aminoadipate transaminase
MRDAIRHSADTRLLSLAAGEPAIDRFPTEAFQRAIDQVLKKDARATWRHGPTEGQPALREAIADRFRVPAESVLIIAGAQQGLDLLARCLIDPGDAVIIDRPGYLGAIQAFRAAGAKLIGWDVLRADVDELEDLLRIRPVSRCPSVCGVSCSSSRSDTECRSSRTARTMSCTSTKPRPLRCTTSMRRTWSFT